MTLTYRGHSFLRVTLTTIYKTALAALILLGIVVNAKSVEEDFFPVIDNRVK